MGVLADWYLRVSAALILQAVAGTDTESVTTLSEEVLAPSNPMEPGSGRFPRTDQDFCTWPGQGAN